MLRLGEHALADRPCLAAGPQQVRPALQCRGQAACQARAPSWDRGDDRIPSWDRVGTRDEGPSRLILPGQESGQRIGSNNLVMPGEHDSRAGCRAGSQPPADAPHTALLLRQSASRLLLHAGGASGSQAAPQRQQFRPPPGFMDTAAEAKKRADTPKLSSQVQTASRTTTWSACLRAPIAPVRH